MNKQVCWKIIYCVGIMGIFLWAQSAAAVSSSSAFEQAYNALYSTFQQARNVVYVLSAFGLIGVAAGGLTGKINLKWLAMLCVALAILASAESVVNYATTIDAVDEDYSGIGDDDFDLDLQFDDDFDLDLQWNY